MKTIRYSEKNCFQSNINLRQLQLLKINLFNLSDEIFL